MHLPGICYSEEKATVSMKSRLPVLFTAVMFIFNKSSRGIKPKQEESSLMHFPIGDEESEVETGVEPVEQSVSNPDRSPDGLVPRKTSSRV